MQGWPVAVEGFFHSLPNYDGLIAGKACQRVCEDSGAWGYESHRAQKA